MDVLSFLKDRTKFIRWYYGTAADPFVEIMRRIEAGEAPFQPLYSEDGEPSFLTEWIEADTGFDVLGRTCISMLSASLQLYFRTWETELRVKWEDGERKRVFKNGFLRGYQVCYGDILGLSWDNCPANLELIEQIVIVRNRDQHPDTITSMRVSHSYRERTRGENLFFVNEVERKMYDVSDEVGIGWLNPSIHVSRDLLFSAIEQVEALAGWLEPYMQEKRWGG